MINNTRATDPLQLGTVQANQALRRQAEETLRQNVAEESKSLAPRSAEETERVLHELRVHQIELEIQNEELRQTHFALGSEKERYFAFYNLAPVGYITISEDGLILEANLTVSNLLGVPRKELIKQPFARFITKKDKDILYLHFKELYKTSKIQVCDLQMEMKKDGTAFWANLISTVVYEKSDSPLCQIVLTDIRERKKAEAAKAELETLKQQLRKTESLGRIAGAIAHHFNNKLHVVMGSLEQTLNDLPPGDTSIASLKTALQATDQAAEISRMMLTYLGQVTGAQESLDLSESCRMSLPMIQTSIPNNVVFQTDLHSRGPVIKANAKQIQQIISNLLTNAWEAVGDNQGTVQLTVKPASLADIAIAHRYPINWQPDGNHYACLEVMDTGCGIASEDFDEVFEPFFSTKFTGRGLGLPVVLGLVRANNGVITVESIPTQRSVFRIFFPMVVGKIFSQPPDKSINTMDFQEGGTVLLVDDDEIVLSITGIMLSNLGFKVLSAKDGVEAVEVFRQHKDEICFVLTDLAMPGMNGWETLTAVRQILPTVKVIMTSGYCEDQVMDCVHSDLPHAFLGKPYGLEALSDVIRRTLANNMEC